jgi:glyoxylase-like metal-dependent hydrolase (beta-lactamase superfamily II)
LNVIHTEQHDDVQRLVLSTRRSRLIQMSVSAYLVRNVLVDSGFAAIGGLLDARLAGESLRGALITHRHEDHAGNAERLARRGLPLGMSSETAEALRAPRPIALYRRYTWGSPPPLATSVPSFEDAELQLIAAPGHSSDHHVVWDAREGTLFSGDLFLGVKVPIAHATERPRELVRSLRMAISLGPARMFDAHRGLVERPVSALEAKVAWLEDVIGRVEDLAKRGWRHAAIQRGLLGREGVPGIFSAGEYSKRNLVRAILDERDAPSSHHRLMADG